MLITVVNGVAEEMFFRGALYTALGSVHPVLISTVVYVVATSAAGNPMLGFAAVILGTVCALERRVTGGVLAPMLTHFFWGLIMVLALPPMFGLSEPFPRRGLPQRVGDLVARHPRGAQCDHGQHDRHHAGDQEDRLHRHAPSTAARRSRTTPA